MCHKKTSFVLAGVILLLSSTLCLADDLKLFMGRTQGEDCIQPFDKTVTIRRQPMPFCVALRNESSSSQSVYWKVEAGAIASLSFELTPKEGQTFTIKPKEKEMSSGQVVSDYLAAGAMVKKTILADVNTWENIPVIEPGKVKEFKIRAIFDNDGSKIYSDYYTLFLDGGGAQ